MIILEDVVCAAVEWYRALDAMWVVMFLSPRIAKVKMNGANMNLMPQDFLHTLIPKTLNALLQNSVD